MAAQASWVADLSMIKVISHLSRGIASENGFLSMIYFFSFVGENFETVLVAPMSKRPAPA